MQNLSKTLISRCADITVLLTICDSKNHSFFPSTKGAKSEHQQKRENRKYEKLSFLTFKILSLSHVIKDRAFYNDNHMNSDRENTIGQHIARVHIMG
jgi:hypothetical protein